MSALLHQQLRAPANSAPSLNLVGRVPLLRQNIDTILDNFIEKCSGPVDSNRVLDIPDYQSKLLRSKKKGDCQ